MAMRPAPACSSVEHNSAAPERLLRSPTGQTNDHSAPIVDDENNTMQVKVFGTILAYFLMFGVVCSIYKVLKWKI